MGEHAGWITCCTNSIIWGVGTTKDASQCDAATIAKRLGCEWDADETRTFPATMRLMTEVMRSGGNIRWRLVDDIADCP